MNYIVGYEQYPTTKQGMLVCLNALLHIFIGSTSHLAGLLLMTLESAGLTLGLHFHTTRFYMAHHTLEIGVIVPQGATHHLTGSHGDVNEMEISRHMTRGSLLVIIQHGVAKHNGISYTPSCSLHTNRHKHMVGLLNVRHLQQQADYDNLICMWAQKSLISSHSASLCPICPFNCPATGH